MRHHLTTPQTEAPATRVEPLDRFASNPISGRQPAPRTVSMSRSSGSSAVASRWQVPYSLIALQAASQPSPADAGARAFGSAVSDRLVTSPALIVPAAGSAYTRVSLVGDLADKVSPRPWRGAIGSLPLW